MTSPRFAVGVDLGTTHCVVASSSVRGREVSLFDVPQLVAPGEIAPRALLPSFLYLPGEGELGADEMGLPWGRASAVVGELARKLGAQVPTRLVSSAKSWICHGGVNRRAPILPWCAPDSAPHISPFDASVQYLAHLRAAWDAAHPQAPLALQDVTVTVPASFDDDARELTVAAAREALLGSVHLLEEPQAAFYDFLGDHGHELERVLGEARLILVVDVGGGTTDLTLMRVVQSSAGAEAPQLERIAVGGHLLLGGDNMDAALARHVLAKAGIEQRLDPTTWSLLIQSAREAKEHLLSPGGPERGSVVLQQRGARLVSGARSLTVEREEVLRLILDGFVPFTGRDEVAERSARVGLTTLGLPYVTDPAIPRHICAFLRRHRDAAREAHARVEDGLPKPDCILLAGGVFAATPLAQRLTSVLESWYGGERIALLPNERLDTAVARGAARYGLARHGLGALIKGGAARAYYLGVEAPAGERQAICIAPRGMEEGASVRVPDRTFQLLTGRPVVFPLYSTSGDQRDPVGAVRRVESDWDPLPALETVVRSQGGPMENAAGGVPVTVAATLAESGSLELYLVSLELPPRRWRLEFALAHPSGEPGEPKPSEVPTLNGPPSPERLASAKAPEGLLAARRIVAERFARGAQKGGPEEIKNVRRDLEAVLGPRGEWPVLVCRTIWESCMDQRTNRGLTSQHELNWLRLAGWGLRPGFGAAEDRDRIARLWTLFADGPVYPRDKANWSEWWVMWRRVSGGLDREQQEAIFERIRPYVSETGTPPRGPRPHGQVEMLRLAAGLERLGREQKRMVGEWFLSHLEKFGSAWPLGRLGARELFRGDARDVVERKVAEGWLASLLALDWQRVNDAAFATALLARMTGDPERDIGAALRAEVQDRLTKAAAPASWLGMVSRPTGLSAKDARELLGDALPAGLRLA